MIPQYYVYLYENPTNNLYSSSGITVRWFGDILFKMRQQSGSVLSQFCLELGPTLCCLGLESILSFQAQGCDVSFRLCLGLGAGPVLVLWTFSTAEAAVARAEAKHQEVAALFHTGMPGGDICQCRRVRQAHFNVKKLLSDGKNYSSSGVSPPQQPGICKKPFRSSPPSIKWR